MSEGISVLIALLISMVFGLGGTLLLTGSWTMGIVLILAATVSLLIFARDL